MRRPLAFLLAALASAVPAAAHHLQMPAVVAFTSGGDATLPRLAPPGTTVALALDAGGTRRIYAARIFDGPGSLVQISQGGDNGNPATALAHAYAWDGVGGSADPGHQVFLRRKDALVQLVHDPTGTSTNPAINGPGSRVVFESTADLASAGNLGSRQIFLFTAKGDVTQLSDGRGDSSAAAMSKLSTRIVFQSASDPATGDDTGVAQIWLSGPVPGSGRRLTAGAGPSRNPAISTEGRFVAFDSTAALTADGADTGVAQVFVLDLLAARLARLTDDGAGCAAPAIRKIPGDWRVGYTCGGQGFFTDLFDGRRYRVPIDRGETARVLPGPGAEFVLVATTADLVDGGTTAGHRIYLLNLFKRPAEALPGDVVWEGHAE